MIIVSNNYKNALNNQISFSPRSKIVVDGIEYLGDVIKTTPKISHSNTSFIGGFPAKTVSFDIYNLNNDLSFAGKEITVYKGLIINDSVEWVKQGIFIPQEKDITNDLTSKTLKISNAQDKTQFLDDKYDSSLDWSNNQTHTGLEIVQEICTKKDIILANTNFAWANYPFKQPNFKEGTTNREVLSRISEIGGEISIFNSDGKLLIKNQHSTGDTIQRQRYEKLSKEKSYVVNTVVLGKSGIDDNIRYPENITENRVELEILDNPFVDLYREEMISKVASHVIGKSYTPFKMDGFVDGFIYEINDVVKVIDNNHNEFNAVILGISNSSRLKSMIKADVHNDTVINYNLAGSSKKAIEQARVEVNHIKNEILAEVNKKVDNEEIIASLNMAIENGKGIVRFISNQFLVEADNLKIDQYGSVQMSNAEIVGGNIELFDDGTRDGSSIKIHTKIDYGTPIEVGTDLSNKKLLFNFDKNTILPNIEPGINYTLLKTNNFQIWIYMISQSASATETNSYHLCYKYLDSAKRNKIAIIKQFDDETPNEITKIIDDLQLNENVGTVTELANYDINDEIVITDQIDKVTNISGYGIDTIIAPRFNYTWDDMAYIMEKLENEGTFTENDIFKYDLNLDGIIDMDDYYNVQWFVLNDITIENPARLKINTQNAKDNFVLTDGYGTDRVAIDFSGIRFKGNTHLSIENDFGEEVISLGADGINIDKGIMSDLFQNNILWQANNSVGGYYMTAEHTVTLSEKISDQSHGVILVWWGFNPSTQTLVGGPVSTQVIPKALISENKGTLFHQDMHYGSFSYSGTKITNIFDDRIVGNSTNVATGTGGSGIKYSNNRFVLSYVIGF